MSSHTKMLTDMLISGADVALIVQVACTIITNLELNLAQERKQKKERAHALSDAWTLPEEGRLYALARGWSEDRVAAEARKFRDRALAKGTKYIDWSAAWRNWCNSPYQTDLYNGHGAAGAQRDDRQQRPNGTSAGNLSIVERKFLRQERTADALRQLQLFAAQRKPGNGRGND